MRQIISGGGTSQSIFMIGDDSQDLRGRLLDVRDESIVLKKSAVRGARLQLGVFESRGFALGSRPSRIRLSGSFAGGTSVAKYFLMEPIGRPSSFDSGETSEIKWATLDEAITLVGMTTNKIGKARDLSVLGARAQALNVHACHLTVLHRR